jgi:hypothetical protein
MDIAIDVSFEPNDAFRETMVAASQPLVLEPEPAPASAPPPAIVATPPVVVGAAPERRTVWWPLVLMGFFAVVCATIAFLKSPLATHPSVAPYANALLAQIDV